MLFHFNVRVSSIVNSDVVKLRSCGSKSQHICQRRGGADSVLLAARDAQLEGQAAVLLREKCSFKSHDCASRGAFGSRMGAIITPICECLWLWPQCRKP